MRRYMSSAVTSVAPLVGEKISNSVALVTLNRPKALNSLNSEMCNLMKALMREWNKGGVGAFIMKGSGEKAFCAGGDVKSIWEDVVRGGDDLGTGKPGKWI